MTSLEWTLIEVYPPSAPCAPIGILLREIEGDRLRVKLAENWSNSLFDGDDSEIWNELAQDLEEKAKEMGCLKFLAWLEENGSHILRVGERQLLSVLNSTEVLDQLYAEHVYPFITAKQRTSRAAETELERDRPPRSTEWLTTRHGTRYAASVLTLCLGIALALRFPLLQDKSPMKPGTLSRAGERKQLPLCSHGWELPNLSIAPNLKRQQSGPGNGGQVAVATHKPLVAVNRDPRITVIRSPQVLPPPVVATFPAQPTDVLQFPLPQVPTY
ncbi:MAG: hypothetical protein JO061_02440, partial [Acidobacteriaceae bacterium]|nr:hypothetical protein [Acidobacteriaceae bacterium]